MNGAREIRVLLPDLSAVQALARRLAPHLRLGDVVALSGDLGAGKTTFAQFLIQELGGGGEVTSPTFTVMQVYETPRFSVYHFDWYRLENPQDVEEIGFDEAQSDGVSLVEWPEKAVNYIPKDALTLRFGAESDGARWVLIDAAGEWRTRLSA